MAHALAVAPLGAFALVALLALALTPRPGSAADDDVADRLVASERRALEALGAGDPDPLLALCAPDVTYFDPDLDARADGVEALAALWAPLRGRQLMASFELRDVRVQRHGDVAVLSFNLLAQERHDGALLAVPWNATEAYARREDGWRLASSHWSYTTPKGAPASAELAPLREEAANAVEVVAVERACLDRWGKGDPGGFIDAAHEEIAYFDPFQAARIDGRDAFRAVMEAVRGKISFDRYELRNPRVQRAGDLAILTFNYVSWSKAPDGAQRSSPWNSTEIYLRTGDGWKQVHSHWSRTRATR